MMIVVVEGINAAGKTTWCRSHGQSYLIPETGKTLRRSGHTGQVSVPDAPGRSDYG
ncbi:hypothetical protein GOA97_25895 [Sinorhizobium meliloti]|nr:hypothetical protein [Sinorhizobium meliloti]MDW9657847.1 hypothetical protein [Sinorhizobium meliloti]MDW9917795.1 hypothetical protein [Sinorhizobium meliloti]MDW9942583.1 hypothetical protein [Sinorhizobium meliloti]MDW9948994.1 hypothetical protein [Sinorhizobium meliloti]